MSLSVLLQISSIVIFGPLIKVTYVGISYFEQIYLLFTGWEVLIGGNCARGLKYPMKLPTIPPGLAGKIVKNRPLPEPIRLQGLENSAQSQTKKKIILDIATQWKLTQVISRVYSVHSYPEIRSSEDSLIFICLTDLTRKSWVFCYPTGLKSFPRDLNWSKTCYFF